MLYYLIHIYPIPNYNMLFTILSCTIHVYLILYYYYRCGMPEGRIFILHPLTGDLTSTANRTVKWTLADLRQRIDAMFPPIVPKSGLYHLCFDTYLCFDPHILYYSVYVCYRVLSYTADLKPELTQPSTATNKLTTSQHLSTTIDTNVTTTSTTSHAQSLLPQQHQHITTSAPYKSAAVSAAGDDNFNDFGYWRKPIPTINI